LPDSEKIRKATFGDDSEVTEKSLETVREIQEYDTDANNHNSSKKRSKLSLEEEKSQEMSRKKWFDDSQKQASSFA
jgi:hypothetical protein